MNSGNKLDSGWRTLWTPQTLMARLGLKLQEYLISRSTFFPLQSQSLSSWRGAVHRGTGLQAEAGNVSGTPEAWTLRLHRSLWLVISPSRKHTQVLITYSLAISLPCLLTEGHWRSSGWKMKSYLCDQDQVFFWERGQVFSELLTNVWAQRQTLRKKSWDQGWESAGLGHYWESMKLNHIPFHLTESLFSHL